MAKERINAEENAEKFKKDADDWRKKFIEIEQIYQKNNIEEEFQIISNENQALKEILKEKEKEINNYNTENSKNYKENEQLQLEVKKYQNEPFQWKNRCFLAEKQLDEEREKLQSFRIDFEILKRNFNDKEKEMALIIEEKKGKEEGFNYYKEEFEKCKENFLISEKKCEELEILVKEKSEEMINLKKFSNEVENETHDRFLQLENAFKRQKINDQKDLIEMGNEMNDFKVEINRLIEINQMLENEIVNSQEIMTNDQKKIEFFKNEIADYQENIFKIKNSYKDKEGDCLIIANMKIEVNFNFKLNFITFFLFKNSIEIYQ